MFSHSLKLFKTDELLCLTNCLRIADDFCMNDNDQFHNCIGVSRGFAISIKSNASTELHSRPDAYDDPEPWVEHPSLTDMSTGAISNFTIKELLCFVNCISATIKAHDYESEFHTLVGVPQEFARVFKSALEREIASRSDNTVQ